MVAGRASSLAAGVSSGRKYSAYRAVRFESSGPVQPGGGTRFAPSQTAEDLAGVARNSLEGLLHLDHFGGAHADDHIVAALHWSQLPGHVAEKLLVREAHTI